MEAERIAVGLVALTERSSDSAWRIQGVPDDRRSAGPDFCKPRVWFAAGALRHDVDAFMDGDLVPIERMELTFLQRLSHLMA
jgi:hypothetical protein